MNAIYLSTSGDTVTTLATPLTVPNYGCGVVELSGKIIIHKVKKEKEEVLVDDEVLGEAEINHNHDMDIVEEKDIVRDVIDNPHDELKKRRRRSNRLRLRRSTREKRSNNDHNRDLYLCGDIVDNSFVNGIKLPVLRCIKRKTNGFIISNLSRVIWLKLNRPFITDIRTYITNSKGEIISLDKNTVECTLLLIPNPI